MFEHVEQSGPKPGQYKFAFGLPKADQPAIALTPDGFCIFGTDSRTTAKIYTQASQPDEKLVKARKQFPNLILQESSLFLKPMHYDDEVERQRRLLCDTALSHIILDHPEAVMPAVKAVCGGIRLFWQYWKSKISADALKSVVSLDGKHAYNKTSFGRLDALDPKVSKTVVEQIEYWLSQLNGNDLPKIMNLFDIFLKVYCRFEFDDKARWPSGRTPAQFAQSIGFRQPWFDDKKHRGRREINGVEPTDAPGLVTSDFTIPWREPLARCKINLAKTRRESRIRGFDRFAPQLSERDTFWMKGSRRFFDSLTDNNLVFSASASGTTSTLLASAAAFAPGVMSGAETPRQYLAACVAYLVGGGMHTCDEVFFASRLAGLKYKSGNYLDMLPESLKKTVSYKLWMGEFWDIVRPDRASPR